MNKIDIDLDVCKLIEGLGEGDDVVLYFRGGDDDIDDFFYFNGNLEYGAIGLANLMKQSDALVEMIRNAIIEYQDEL